MKRVISIIFVLGTVLITPLAGQENGPFPARPSPEPFTESEWQSKRAEFLRLYNSKSSDKRQSAIEFIDKSLAKQLLEVPCNYAVETMEFLFQVLSVEADDDVLFATKDLLARFIVNKKTGIWISINHPKNVTQRQAKLRFIDALFRASAIFQNDAVGILFDLTKDTDQAIGKAALKTIAEIKNLIKLDGLARLLAEEKRPEMKKAIGQALEKITGMKFAEDANAWQKWLMEKPVEQNLVDNGIKDGVSFLLNKKYIKFGYENELIFYTLVRSGVEIPDASMKAYLKDMLTTELNGTYNVSLLVMALVELDRVKYLERIAQCAEFLLANQNNKGSWRYGMPVTKLVRTPGPGPLVITPSSPPATPTGGTSTKSVKKIKIRMPPRRRDSDYDNSCTQYALLGLRACADANIDIPLKVWADAERHLLDDQTEDGGWSYQKNEGPLAPYGSMSAGGLGSLAICKYYQSKKIDGDKNIKWGADWLAKHFSILDNPQISSPDSFSPWHYYYLYALERAGALLNTEYFGSNRWYTLGARYLLGEQKSDGSWTTTLGPWCGNDAQPIVSGDTEATETCFAILFLRRATKPLKIVITDGKEENK
jgi:hypothetical protein